MEGSQDKMFPYLALTEWKNTMHWLNQVSTALWQLSAAFNIVRM
jgi:hypothetical protein